MLTKEQLDALLGHTSGPWCNVDYSLSNEIKTLRNPLIAIVQSRYCDSPEELRTNAALIAAAPDLLTHIDEQQAEIDDLRKHAESMYEAAEAYQERIDKVPNSELFRRLDKASKDIKAYRAAYPKETEG